MIFNQINNNTGKVANKIEIQPGDLEVRVGRLKILHKNAGQGPSTGIVTRVFLDDQEITGVMALDLRIRPEELITATIELITGEVG